VILPKRAPNQFSPWQSETLILQVKKANVQGLHKKLDQINGLDKDGLKELYKEIIKNTTISDKGGAGLGFVDMARKSGGKLEFEFPEMSSEYCFFCLKVNVPRETE
jgi:hypothetical protein